jgi:uncharacterized membrane protein (UPF0127 family)
MNHRAHILIGILLLILILAAILFYAEQASSACGAYKRTEINFASTTVTVDIADTDCKQALGLSGRARLEENTGMLFSFASEGIHTFWMKDMRFPIDIIWLDPSGKITGVEQNVKPETYPETFGGDYLSQYVLELPAGFMSKHSMVK